MIVDTSAIVAILLNEPEADHFLQLLGSARPCSMSAGSWIEVAAVLVRRNIDVTEQELRAFADKIELIIAPVTLQQAEIAQSAYIAFGRGTRHPARLNFGDCFAYALAKATGEPLLFKGDDFAHTDVIIALPS